MNNHEILSMQEIKLQHLSIQYQHLQVVSEYHRGIATLTADPTISDLHRTLAEQIEEALKHLGQIISTLQTRSLVETKQTSITAYEGTLTSG